MSKAKKSTNLSEGSGFSKKDCLSPKVDSEVGQCSEVLRYVPESFRTGYLRALRGEVSPRMAIKTFCCQCCGWARAEVRLCSGRDCPLFAYRPYVGEEVEK